MASPAQFPDEPDDGERPGVSIRPLSQADLAAILAVAGTGGSLVVIWWGGGARRGGGP
jgi:hypothetical protein